MPPYAWPAVKARTAEEQLKFDFEIACGYKPNLTIVESVLSNHPGWATFGLYEAIHHNRMNIVNLLIAAKGEVNGFMPFACWRTPLMHAVRYKEPRWGLAEFLLENGVPVNSTNGLGMSALHIAIFYGIPEAANWLLDHGADINFVKPEFCSTPLGWAARWGRAEMVKLLLNRGANVSLPGDIQWAQPKNWAKQKNHEDIFHMLDK